MWLVFSRAHCESVIDLGIFCDFQKGCLFILLPAPSLLQIPCRHPYFYCFINPGVQEMNGCPPGLQQSPQLRKGGNDCFLTPKLKAWWWGNSGPSEDGFQKGGMRVLLGASGGLDQPCSPEGQV